MEYLRNAHQHTGIDGSALKYLIDIRATVGKLPRQPDNGLVLSFEFFLYTSTDVHVVLSLSDFFLTCRRFSKQHFRKSIRTAGYEKGVRTIRAYPGF